ncbi:hypothetical protein BKA67DRAFT_564401 [Truncatella angustata]|uniref:BZIP domain-containing protein n=1 Tax=Truncatella angustata TaxID=152316 RepID=A0A9P8ZXP0_9PEZI|nr:uncharacterized protein BKA67DRAFT_564401 [Truncatella angustata]KAH6654199.1 hypothetical protein BKA67DRAFT_564401 [Truncatella angustata]
MPRKVQPKVLSINSRLRICLRSSYQQNKTPASQSQNRESQRRSRARQRELVEDLRKRLDEFEQRGVRATMEMQEAARAVVAENQLLRALLATHNVSRKEIEDYLSLEPMSQAVKRTRYHKGRDAISTHKLRPAESAQPQSEPRHLSAMSFHRPTHCRASPRQLLLATDFTANAQSVSESVHASISDSSAQAENEIRMHVEVPQQDRASISHLCNDIEHDIVMEMLPPVSDCFCPPESSAAGDGSTETLDTSCETAAAIISALTGESDIMQASVVLGCTKPSDCFINS